MRLDMVLEETLRGLERGWSELYFCVVFHPDLQPTPHGVGLGSSVVVADVFFDSPFQFLLDLVLRFSEDILDDSFSSFGIVTDGVAALPAAVLPFPYVFITVDHLPLVASIASEFSLKKILLTKIIRD